MAILSSRNGKFYEVPDKDLGKYELPAEKVKEVLGEMDEGPHGPGVEPYGAPAQVVIHVGGNGAMVDGGPPPQGEGGVQPYGYYGGYGYGYGYPYFGWRRKRHYYYGY